MPAFSYAQNATIWPRMAHKGRRGADICRRMGDGWRRQDGRQEQARNQQGQGRTAGEQNGRARAAVGNETLHT